MKLKPALKYIINSISYGVLFAVALLLLKPNLNDNTFIKQLLSTEQQETSPLSYAKAVSVASPAVVNIYSEDIMPSSVYGQAARKTTTLGSGVIMDSNGYILTNLHVIQNADLIHVVLQNGQQFPAQIIGFDKITDLAVLKVNASNLPTIPQKYNQQSLAGDIVLAIGNPLNLGQTVTQGIISATGRSGLSNTSYLNFLQMDAAINEGNSGGALVNSNGVLVGINSRKFTQSNPQLNIQGIFFAVPYELAAKIMQQIIENGRVVRGWLGISATQYSTDAKGIVVEEVSPNSPAKVGNIQVGDILYQIGSQPINSIVQALDIVAETKPNTTLIFKLYRQGKIIETNITIAEFTN
ncbi:trypsin-like peptidase domain-containing protein [Colwellia sp. 4_MG-2023]|uniref:trypsin-like peptidase domain-containing protein n=1 Tax=unclassified Colwellia TaxID=196834 RepID=UPI001C0A2B10|nr:MULTISPECIES: trypsin-like peptidase domain-containing protein [unclassified Colwellia]MBU2926254.1 trypsin-like peptidase domain-containing protein [Colwellia sp. C2M11]MDO6508501.1 trypsin-like peptidase domain-containing protein [Colwellia sp. 5_MG-2023]MDO6557116.1 trypsin-like peptidase domain-containing protein [Colwellia sp. 4_MG-2023]MDO6652324.1 trypsin-like peptidase domain-containing protein [Colwellia sp. 3_MG-2023]MDO6666916.1 trypsin-like peptidase domain-containing protein [C